MKVGKFKFKLADELKAKPQHGSTLFVLLRDAMNICGIDSQLGITDIRLAEHLIRTLLSLEMQIKYRDDFWGIKIGEKEE